MDQLFFRGKSSAFLSGERMMNSIEEYIQTVNSQVHFIWDRTAIAEELRDHLTDSAEALMEEENLSAEEAQAEAVKRMGDGKTIGQQFNQIHHPVIGWIWLITLSLAFIAGIALVGLTVNYAWDIFSCSFPVHPKAAVKIRDLNESVDMAGHVVWFDAVWEEQEDQLILTYRIQNKLNYSRSGWSVTLFQIVDQDGNEGVSPYFEGNSLLGSRGMIRIERPDSGKVKLTFIDGQKRILNVSEQEGQP